ncbi:MAG TPA: transporter substrate-binding domain-containing protein [Spirochaetales bacterium]|nr:transporter substrate-binding domain-containing protein [Spirochaetales bacterium]
MRLSLACLALAFSLAAPPLASAAPAASAAAPAGERILVGYYDARPSCWRGEDGEAKGIFVDILKEVAVREGWSLEFSYQGWDGLLEALKSGSVDLVPAIARSEPRSSYAAFTEETIFLDWGAVFVGRSGKIRSILDLGGRRVGALENDIWFSGPGALRDLCASFLVEPDYVFFPDYSSLFRALGSGAIDAAAGSNSLGVYWESMEPIAATPIVYLPLELRVAGPARGSRGSRLVGAVDRRVRELKEETPGALRSVLERYAVPARREYVTPPWVVPSLLLLAAFLALIVLLLLLQAAALRRSHAEAAAALAGLEEAHGSLESSFKEKDLLLHELSHRVKNNFQLILSLISMAQAGEEEERGGSLAEIREKIYALSVAEELLHGGGGVDEAAVRAFVERLASRLSELYGASREDLEISVRLGRPYIDPSAATPLAQALSELAANACRHGRGEDGRASLSIAIESAPDGSGSIVVSDRGPGLPPGFSLARDARLGLGLVSALAAQLRGRLEAGPGPGGRGASFAIRLPAEYWLAPEARPAPGAKP